MNYDEAREVADKDGKPTGIWHWTSRNDREIRIALPCTAECRHETRESAELHFYEWSLQRVEEYDMKDRQLKCKVCGEWTTKGLSQLDFQSYPFAAPLCEEHRTIEHLRKLFPMTPGMMFCHS